MRGFIANTDYDWFTYLKAIKPSIDEVNFWKPGETAFRALSPGEPVFFKLKAPHNAIAGFGYFVHFSTLPVSMAWQVYGDANGAATFSEVRERLYRIRKRFEMDTDPTQDFRIGCVLVNEPVFFEKPDWVRVPADWAPNIMQGKTLDLSAGEGRRIWLECLATSAAVRGTSERYEGLLPGQRVADGDLSGGYGTPSPVRPRLGQRSFRIAVLDTYSRRCAITNERTLPVLEAAHIRDFSDVQTHAVSNGILFRADIHKLFDAGYVTVTPDYHFEVSRRIKEEFENGRDYYALHGTTIRIPTAASLQPSTEALHWHNEQRYLG